MYVIKDTHLCRIICVSRQDLVPAVRERDINGISDGDVIVTCLLIHRSAGFVVGDIFSSGTYADEDLVFIKNTVWAELQGAEDDIDWISSLFICLPRTAVPGVITHLADFNYLN